MWDRPSESCCGTPHQDTGCTQRNPVRLLHSPPAKTLERLPSRSPVLTPQSSRPKIRPLKTSRHTLMRQRVTFTLQGIRRDPGRNSLKEFINLFLKDLVREGTGDDDGFLWIVRHV